MFKRIISLLLSPFILLGGPGDLDPQLPKPEPAKEEIVLYQTDELSVTATDFTYATSVMFNYTITNKTDSLLKFNLPYTSVAGSEQSKPLQCMLKAGTTSESLTYIQPESMHQQALKLSINEYDEYNLEFDKVGKILIIGLQPVEDVLAVDLVYDGKARVFKAEDGFYIDNVPLDNVLTTSEQAPSYKTEGACSV